MVNLSQKRQPWPVLKTKVVYKNEFLGEIQEETVIREDNSRAQYYTLKRPFDYSIIIPERNKKLYLVNLYRPAVKAYHWEFPMGRLDPKETPLQAAKRELKEETGITARRWKKLGSFVLAQGFSSQRGHVFLARNLKVRFDQADPEPGEFMVIRKFSLNRIKKMIKSGKISDASSLTAWLQYRSL